MQYFVSDHGTLARVQLLPDRVAQRLTSDGWLDVVSLLDIVVTGDSLAWTEVSEPYARKLALEIAPQAVV